MKQIKIPDICQVGLLFTKSWLKKRLRSRQQNQVKQEALFSPPGGVLHRRQEAEGPACFCPPGDEESRKRQNEGKRPVCPHE